MSYFIRRTLFATDTVFGGKVTDAKRQVRQYFAQGHEVNFVAIEEWLIMVLATVGRRGRDIFTRTLLQLLESEETPMALRVSWNQQLERITTG